MSGNSLHFKQPKCSTCSQQPDIWLYHEPHKSRSWPPIWFLLISTLIFFFYVCLVLKAVSFFRIPHQYPVCFFPIHGTHPQFLELFTWISDHGPYILDSNIFRLCSSLQVTFIYFNPSMKHMCTPKSVPEKVNVTVNE